MSTFTRPAFARPRSALLAVLVLVAAVLGGAFAATPAFAHDELVATTPSAGETVTSAPASIGLEFSQEIFPEGTFAEVRGEDGADYVDGTPTVEGTIVTIPLKAALPNGVYTVNWQITSSDGHPTQGSWDFTIAAEQAPVTEATPDPSETPVASAAAEPTPGATGSSSAGAASDAARSSVPASPAAESGSPVLGIVVGIIVIVAVVAVLAILLLRRRATRG